MFASHRRPRRAFTMVELLVVIGILLTIAVIGYLALPKNMAADYNRTRGIDQMMEWLLTAKQRAKRDLAPTGIRLVDPATNLAATNSLPTGVMYVQQPDLMVGTSTGGTCKNTAGKASTTINFSNVDFLGGAAIGGQADEALVQPGDYLLVPSGVSSPSGVIGAVHQITSPVTATSLTLTSALKVPSNTQTYYIYRQPRPISGEEVKQLPPDLVVDLTLSLNVPSRSVSYVNATGKTITVTFYEIVFSQSGSVVGYGTSGGKIVLMMRDTNPTSNPPNSVNLNSPSGPVTVTGPLPTLISIQSRSGFIGAFDVATGGSDAYLYTEDGRSSGL